MGLADYQKQKEIKTATEATSTATREVRDAVMRLLEEQKVTNKLLTQLLAK